MNRIRFYLWRILCATSLLALMLSFSGALTVQAQEPDPDCSNGACGTNPTPQNVAAQSGAYLKSYSSTTLHGGYVAHGVGMRNLGYGTIKVTDVPSGASVSKAYLYWAVIGPQTMTGYKYAKGIFNGHTITGTLIGSSANPCWGGGNIWGYRADVHSYMIKGGNGTYGLAGFASGKTNGDDPFQIGSSLPMIDGATLVIIFTKTGYPNTTIKIYNGLTTAVYNQLYLTISGVNAVVPTGFAYSTFVVADGQNDYSYPGSTHFFLDPVPAVWDGADPNGNGVSYSKGNLWDTVTVDLHKMLKPPEPDFWFTTDDSNGSGADCVSWEAQVLAYSSGNQDSDGDKLLDSWELNGYSGVNLPAVGADPLHKDLFVEADYMNDGGGQYDWSLPAKAQLDDVVNSFNQAPVSNPDGTTGIHLHIDTGGAAYGDAPGSDAAYNLGGGNSIPLQTNLGSSGANCSNYDWTAFQNLKNTNFGAYRSPIFHYVIFAYNLAPGCGTTSGISRNGSPDSIFVKGATDFIVSLGGWPSHGTSTEREGTFMHELGHNLGLRHGGNDHVSYKPNYLSVMNYFFQTSGVYRDGGLHYDYSRFTLPTLNETSLKEPAGLGPLTIPDHYATKWYCSNGTIKYTYADSWLDWNCDAMQESSVSADINYDGSKTSLGTQNNWAHITLSGNGVIGSGKSIGDLAYQVSAMSLTSDVNELTYEQNQAINQAPLSAPAAEP